MTTETNTKQTWVDFDAKWLKTRGIILV